MIIDHSIKQANTCACQKKQVYFIGKWPPTADNLRKWLELFVVYMQRDSLEWCLKEIRVYLTPVAHAMAPQHICPMISETTSPRTTGPRARDHGNHRTTGSVFAHLGRMLGEKNQPPAKPTALKLQRCNRMLLAILGKAGCIMLLSNAFTTQWQKRGLLKCGDQGPHIVDLMRASFGIYFPCGH